MSALHEETALANEGRRPGAIGPGEDEPIVTRADDAAQRVITYVDGFNLYNGVKARFGHRYLWLDVETLSENLLIPGQTLTESVYFTARVRDDNGRQFRQTTYLAALSAACTRLTIVEGRFKKRHRRCPECGGTWLGYEEKQTDVSIATRLVTDVAADKVDIAMIISADSDLCPVVDAIRGLGGGVRVVAAFPPRRQSNDLRCTADGWLKIGEDKLRTAQLPDIVTARSGVLLKRPDKWR